MPKMSTILKAKTKSLSKHWVESALDEILLEDSKQEYKKRTYFRPSSAHWCQRCLWYQMMGYSQPQEEPIGLRRMGIGTAYHEFIQERLARTNLIQEDKDIELEVFNDDPPMRGFVDGILTHPSTGEKYVMELKSRNEGTRYAQKTILPTSAHLIQWNLYSHMSGIEKGIIFYVNKGNNQYQLYEVEQNESIIENVFDKFKLVWDAIQNNERVPFVECTERFDPYREISERDWYIKGE